MFTNSVTKLNQLFFSRVQQRAFLEDLSSLVEEGVPASQAVQTIDQIVTGSLKMVSESILRSISAGEPIAEGMRGWFSNPIVEIIRAGEVGGVLAKTLRAAAESLGEKQSNLSTVLASLAYPLAVVVMGLVVAVFIKHSIFVNFADIKPVSTWPADGQVLYHLATFLESWWWAVLIGIGLVITFITIMLRELTGKTRRWIDGIPLLRLYRDAVAARFMQTVGLLLANGVVFKVALEMMQQSASRYIAWHLFHMEFRLSGGRENLAEVMDTGLINRADILRLKVIAKGGGFEKALLHLGAHATDRKDKAITVASKVTGGVLLALGGVLAAFMVFAIYDVGSFVAK